MLDAAGVARPERVEGTSVLPALRGEPVTERSLYWEHIGNAAIRRGRWKLVRDHPAPWELYDIDADRTERHDLAADFPDVVADLAAEWQVWADRVGVVPWDRMLAATAAAGRPEASAEE